MTKPDRDEPFEVDPASTESDLFSRKRWLARLSFSFLIVAIYLGYTAYRGVENGSISTPRAALYGIAAVLAFVMFGVGTRYRHES